MAGGMKLWLLRPADWSEDGKTNMRQWRNPYDKAHGFVVRANTEKDARAWADLARGDEGAIWSDPGITSCSELAPGGAVGVVMVDFNAG